MRDKQEKPSTGTQITVAVAARVPIVTANTHEQERMMALIANSLSNMLSRLPAPKQATLTAGSILSFSKGIVEPKNSSEETKLTSMDNVPPPEDMIFEFVKTPGHGVLVLFDMVPLLKESLALQRALREAFMALKKDSKHYKTIFLVGPYAKTDFPASLEQVTHVLEVVLPSLAYIEKMLQDAVDRNPVLVPGSTVDDLEGLASALLGATELEVARILGITIAKHKALRIPTLVAAKKSMIEASGVLQYTDTSSIALEDVGGMDTLKAWLHDRRRAFTQEAADFGIKTPKGVLLLGPPGVGKSLVAKVIGASWGMPLITLDIGRVMGSYVGESEHNMDRALMTAAAVAPCVMMLDEIEKALGGSSNDGGTSLRVFGKFLSWMQDNPAPVFVVATANDISGLPPELLRKGRFDEIFMVDLPVPAERAEILGIHLGLSGRLDLSKYDMSAMTIATDGFSGSELQAVVSEGLILAFSQKSELQTEHMIKAARETVPLSRTMKEKIEATREWAGVRARYASSAQKEAYVGKRETVISSAPEESVLVQHGHTLE